MGELKPRVFVVDDDQSVRTGLANLLETEHYAVEMFARAIAPERGYGRSSAPYEILNG
jgi:DNA-binding NtrC family response regulator